MNPIPPLYRWIAIGLALAALYGLGWMNGNHHAQLEAEGFEKATDALGKAAEKHAKETDKKQRDNYERATDDLKKANKAAADRAVSNYLKLHPRWVQNCPGSGNVPQPAASDQGDDGTRRELLLTDRDFIQRCARDAGKLGVWQSWAMMNGIPVE